MKKSKEEIGRLGIDYSDLINMSIGITSYSIADAVVYGYNQCQIDTNKQTKEQSENDAYPSQYVKELKNEIERLKRIELCYYKLTGCAK